MATLSFQCVIKIMLYIIVFVSIISLFELNVVESSKSKHQLNPKFPVEVDIFSNITLSCEATTTSKPIEYSSWFFNRNVIKECNSDSECDYVIKNAQMNDSGIYKCIAVSERIVSISSPIEVKIKENIVKFHLKPSTTLDTEYLSNFSLSCSVSGPLTKNMLMWVHEDMIVKYCDDDCEYTVNGTEAKDVGNYYCVAVMNMTVFKSSPINVTLKDISKNINCPHDMDYYKGKCYATYKYELSWDTAFVKCQAIGGVLVDIDAAEENEFMAELKDHRHEYLKYTEMTNKDPLNSETASCIRQASDISDAKKCATQSRFICELDPKI